MSVSREDIKKGMKQDAAAAWAKIKKLAGRWWVYGAVALGVGGSSAPLPEQNASLGASPFEQSLNEGSRRLENKLKISEMKYHGRKKMCSKKRLKSVAGQWVRRLREICLWLS